MKTKKTTIQIQGHPVRMEERAIGDYICITDIAKTGEGNHHDIVKNYLKNGNNIAFLRLWEEMHNGEVFNSVVADLIKKKSVDNNFTLSVKAWLEQTNAIGIEAVAGRYGGTYAHKDIAIHFSTWLSPVAYLYVIKEVQRLKDDELKRLTEAEHTKKWIFEKVMYQAEELRSVAQLGFDLDNSEEE